MSNSPDRPSFANPDALSKSERRKDNIAIVLGRVHGKFLVKGCPRGCDGQPKKVVFEKRGLTDLTLEQVYAKLGLLEASGKDDVVQRFTYRERVIFFGSDGSLKGQVEIPISEDDFENERDVLGDLKPI